MAVDAGGEKGGVVPGVKVTGLHNVHTASEVCARLHFCEEANTTAEVDHERARDKYNKHAAAEDWDAQCVAVSANEPAAHRTPAGRNEPATQALLSLLPRPPKSTAAGSKLAAFSLTRRREQFLREGLCCLPTALDDAQTKKVYDKVQS